MGQTLTTRQQPAVAVVVEAVVEAAVEAAVEAVVAFECVEMAEDLASVVREGQWVSAQ